jgi:DNA polymerase
MNDIALSLDFETRSRAPLKTCGAEVYAAHPSTEVLCLAYAFGSGAVKSWVPGEPFPADVKRHIEAGGRVTAWNAIFEWHVWAEQRRRAPHIWPELKLDQLHDTMALARAMGFPAALGSCAEAMGLPVQKDTRGHTLLSLLSVPMKNGEFREDAALLAEMKVYCIQDVKVEREILNRLPPLNDFERKLWVLDATINNRGVGVDVADVRRALDLVTEETAHLSQRAKDASGGVLKSLTAVAKLKMLLFAEGEDLKSLSKDAVSRALEDGVGSAVAKELLELRKLAAKASTGKLKAFLNGAGTDGRARGLFAYHGADTGRWAGRRVQLQNMPRPPDDFDGQDVITALEQPEGREYLRDWYGNPLDAVSWGLRSLIKAKPGHKLVSCDFSNIEGRCLAWEADEEWKLDAFRDYDTITGYLKGKPLRAGPDLYLLAYSKSFGVAVEDVTKAQRQIGKVQELALGYQGGRGAFATMAANYGITVIEDNAPRPNHGEVLTVSEVEAIKRGWRDAHPNTCQMWRNLAGAAARAVETPGKAVDAGPVKYRVTDNFLFCRLPSGRLMSYPYPSIERVPSYGWRQECATLAATALLLKPTGPALAAATTLAGVSDRAPLASVLAALHGFVRAAALVIELGSSIPVAYDLIGRGPEELVPTVVCWGRDKKAYSKDGKPKKIRWGKWQPYGGLFAENITQAIARDILAESMFRAEANGYPIIMHVHDELVCEVLESFGSVSELAEIMRERPKWARGLPIAAEGWEGERYRK